MTSDDLQKLASMLRWIGLGVTAIGLAITFASHAVADRLLLVQRNEKVRSQERQLAAEKELEKTKATVNALEFASKPRSLSTESRSKLVASLASAKQHVPIVVTSRMMDLEAQEFASQIASAFTEAKWKVEFSPLATTDFTGIRVVTSGVAQQDERTVRNAFERSGVGFDLTPFSINRSPIQLVPAIYVFVGQK